MLNPPGSTEFNLFSFDFHKKVDEKFIKYALLNDRTMSEIDPGLVGLVRKMETLLTTYDERKIVIDYKVKNLKAGEAGSGIYGYHLDCSTDIHDTFMPETHLIYATVIGSRFVTNPINVEGFKTVKEVINESTLNEIVAVPYQVHRFSSKVLHSSPRVTQDCQRIVIRLTAGFTDRCKNRNR